MQQQRAEADVATLNMSGVKVSPRTRAAMKALWKRERGPQESFGAWVRRKVLAPQHVQNGEP